MDLKLNEKYLITTDNWFYGTDGEMYKAVFGTVKKISSSEQTLGIKTNRGSTNWYVVIGNMIVAGCQIYYCIRTDEINDKPPVRYIEYEGELKIPKYDKSHIFMADK